MTLAEVAAYHANPTPEFCPCGGHIEWIEMPDRWAGSCYGQCGDYPFRLKTA